MFQLIAIITVVFATAAGAQEGETEKDPFYPSENGPAATAPAPVDDPWGRDPFNSPLAGKAAVQKATGRNDHGKGLTGIIYSKDVRVAIIGGEALREGSVVDDRKLVDIRKRSVVFANAAGGREEVFLEDFSIRK